MKSFVPFGFGRDSDSWVRAGRSWPGVLLRVPRPSASSFTYAKHPASPDLSIWCVCVLAVLFRAVSVCLGVLLRVPRPSTSSLYGAKHPASPISGFFHSTAFKFSHFVARGMACLLQRSKEGGRRPDDMSGSRCAMPLAGSATPIRAHAEPVQKP